MKCIVKLQKAINPVAGQPMDPFFPFPVFCVRPGVGGSAAEVGHLVLRWQGSEMRRPGPSADPGPNRRLLVFLGGQYGVVSSLTTRRQPAPANQPTQHHNYTG